MKCVEMDSKVLPLLMQLHCSLPDVSPPPIQVQGAIQNNAKMPTWKEYRQVDRVHQGPECFRTMT